MTCPELFDSAHDRAGLSRLLKRPACQRLAAAILTRHAQSLAGPSTTLAGPWYGVAPETQRWSAFAEPSGAGFALQRTDPLLQHVVEPGAHQLLAGTPANLSLYGMMMAAEAEAGDDIALWVKLLLVTIYACLAFMGVVGNLMVITVVLRVPGMITPTNCYLMSLAASDCLFFFASLPQECNNLLGSQTVYAMGPVGCAFLTYIPYLCINSSSLSITAFTIERFIGICYPLKARYICTVSRAKLIIVCIWLFGILYNSPWLFLAKVISEEHEEYCSFSLERSNVMYKFMYVADFMSCYLIPMILYLCIYAKITYTLMKCTVNSNQNPKTPLSTECSQPLTEPRLSNGHNNSSSSNNRTVRNGGEPLPPSQGQPPTRLHAGSVRVPAKRPSTRGRVQVQVIKMLAVVVIIFAVCWLPYRAMVMYNSFADDYNQFSPLWYVYCAKILIFFNCAINPILYNVMSARFRNAFRRFLRGDRARSPGARCSSTKRRASRPFDEQRPFVPALLTEHPAGMPV